MSQCSQHHKEHCCNEVAGDSWDTPSRSKSARNKWLCRRKHDRHVSFRNKTHTTVDTDKRRARRTHPQHPPMKTLSAPTHCDARVQRGEGCAIRQTATTSLNCYFGPLKAPLHELHSGKAATAEHARCYFKRQPSDLPDK